ncbi:MAG: ABC transporter ATP-binding protein [Burkholderiaceae bacterium]
MNTAAPNTAASNTTPMIEVRDLSVAYGDAIALDAVSIDVRAHEIVAIVGANGAGKTTLIRTIAGILAPRSGRIHFEGEPITGLGSHRVCNLGIGQVAEGRQVFPTMTVLENLEIGGMLPRARAGARQTLDRVFALYPRLAERRGQLAGTLSGGEQQMLAIGRCLMGAPRLIMFDEPSLGLAPAIVSEVLATIADLHREGITIILVEQNVAASLRLAHRAYVLENGTVALQGSGQDLLHDPRVREAYMGL